MKKHFIIILAALLLVQATACSQEQTQESAIEETTQVPEESVPEVETIPAELVDELPKGLDFNGEQINFIIRPEFAHYDADGISAGGNIEDAVYNRNLAVEERLNVDLNYIHTANNDFTIMAQQVQNVVLANSDELDVVMQRGLQTFPQALRGYFIDLNNLEYINLDKKWWWEDSLSSTLVDPNKVPYAIGDMSISTIMASTALYFNKEMLADYGKTAEDLYSIVENGEWTYDKFEEYAADIYEDTNGNGTQDAGDTYAAIILPHGFPLIMYSSGLHHTQRDENNLPYVNIMTEKNQKFAESISRIFNDEPYFYKGGGDHAAMASKFMAGEAVFQFERFMMLDYIREMEDAYGIIPYPKFDEADDYMSGIGAGGNFISIPVTSAKQEITGAALEALAVESYTNVTPVFIDSSLKTKYVDSQKDCEMVSLILDHIYIDMMNLGIPNFVNVLETVVVSGKPDTFASTYQANKESNDAAVANMIAEAQEVQ